MKHPQQSFARPVAKCTPVMPRDRRIENGAPVAGSVVGLRGLQAMARGCAVPSQPLLKFLGNASLRMQGGSNLVLADGFPGTGKDSSRCSVITATNARAWNRKMGDKRIAVEIIRRRQAMYPGGSGGSCLSYTRWVGRSVLLCARGWRYTPGAGRPMTVATEELPLQEPEPTGPVEEAGPTKKLNQELVRPNISRIGSRQYPGRE